MVCWNYIGNGFWELKSDGKKILKAYAYGESADGRRVDTRTDDLTLNAWDSRSNQLILRFTGKEGLSLVERLNVDPDGMALVDCELRSADGQEDVATRKLAPLVFCPPDIDGGSECPAIWTDLWKKMLAVPYDNTMWVRWEAVPFRAGRMSSEITVLYSEESREGILVGALDFDRWKNGLICSATDANTVEARSGVADERTHDIQPHGVLTGREVSSARFGVLYGEDYRLLLESYGNHLRTDRAPLHWSNGVPFGFNSWAGLAFRLSEERYENSGNFLRENLMPEGYQNQGITYVNLDAGWNVMSEQCLEAQTERLHHAGQKAGIYDTPFAFFGRDAETEIPEVPGHRYVEILQRDTMGRLLPRLDGAIPYDITHPLWRQMTERRIDRFIKWGFDYVKLDFMSHGGMEGGHYDPAVTTGRQAINQGYAFLNDLLREDRIGRPFFISLSIAPTFPYGYGHARRASCDAFGTAQDVEYELNSQTYGWWLSGRLYQYNDPDHIVLFKSFCMKNNSTEGEARARYTTAVIGGTVMMLSDDYEDPMACERTKKLATNRAVNQIAASQVAFVPVESAQSSASRAYTAAIDGRRYVALFHWNRVEETVALCAARAGLHEQAVYVDLWSGKTYATEDGVLRWTVSDCDALLLMECEQEPEQA